MVRIIILDKTFNMFTPKVCDVERFKNLFKAMSPKCRVETTFHLLNSLYL
ncbi:hypothetical protein MWR47_03285 [Staphylococcus hominis]|nr:hypothetical protein [Staphylococcus hominis]MEB5575368.1 hypothetical protein [Staphylococcus hominis]